MNHLNELVENEEIFLRYLNEKYPFISKSNFFLRDIQFGINYFFKNKDQKLRLTESETLAIEFTKHLVKSNKARMISKNTWRLDYEFPKPEKKEELTEETGN